MIAQLKSPQPTDFPGYDLPPVPRQGTRVILLRHGRSTLNDAGCYQGSSEQSDLTPQGWLASQRVGQFLAHCPMDAIYVSPLTRAQNTVAALLPQLQTPTPKALNPSPLLREIHLPEWEGRSYAEVRSQEITAYRCWQETPEQLQMQGEEGQESFYPVQDLYQRAAQFWQRTLPRHRGQTLLVVSHGGTNQALLNLALGLSPRQHHRLQQTHSGLTVLDFDGPQLGNSRLHILNLTLTERLPKLKAGKQGLRLLLLPCQAHISPAPDLADLLQGETVQAAVIEDGQSTQTPRPTYPCRQANQSLLRHNPETVVFSVQRSQLWHQWQAAIDRSLQGQHHDGLTTVLAVAQPQPLQRLLKTMLTLPDDADGLALKSNTLSVVHYPSAQARPILQTMNLAPTG